MNKIQGITLWFLFMATGLLVGGLARKDMLIIYLALAFFLVAGIVINTWKE